MTQPIVNVIAGLYAPYEYEDLTVDNTAGGVFLAVAKVKPGEGVLKDAQRIIMTLETAAIRYTTDGTAPTTTLGHLLNSGAILVLLGEPTISNFRAIRTGGSSGTFRCTYER